MAEQPYQSLWRWNPVYNPFCVPRAGFRNGNPYSPYYPVALHGYPGFILLSPVPVRINQRPAFPEYHHIARFQHRIGLGKKMETKETQTDPQKPENKCKKRDLHLEAESCDINGMTSVHITTVETKTDNASEKTNGALSSVTQEREILGQNPYITNPCRNTSPGSYDFEKDDVGTEYGTGSPAMQFSMSFKETIPLYDLACSKAMPEDKVQHHLIPGNSGESKAGRHYNLPEGEGEITYTDEQRADMLSEQYPEGVREKVSGFGMEMSLYKEKKRYETVSRMLSLPVKVKAADNGQSKGSHNTPRSEMCKSIENVNKLQPGRPLCSSTETGNDPSVQSNAQNTLRDRERVPEISFVSPETVPLPSPSWLNWFKYIDDISYDMSRFSWNDPLTSSEKIYTQERLFSEGLELAYYKERFTEYLQRHKYEYKLQKGKKPDFEKKKDRKLEYKREKDWNPETSSSNQRTTCALKENVALGSSLSEDSEDWKIQEESENGNEERYEIECLFQEVCPQDHMNLSKCRLYQEVGRKIIWKPPESSFSPQLILWPTKNKLKLKLGAYESIPLVYKVKEQESCETTYGSGQKKQHSMTKQESKRTSHRSSESNSGRSNMKAHSRPTNKSEISG